MFKAAVDEGDEMEAKSSWVVDDMWMCHAGCRCEGRTCCVNCDVNCE